MAAIRGFYNVSPEKRIQTIQSIDAAIHRRQIMASSGRELGSTRSSHFERCLFPDQKGMILGSVASGFLAGNVQMHFTQDTLLTEPAIDCSVQKPTLIQFRDPNGILLPSPRQEKNACIPVSLLPENVREVFATSGKLDFLGMTLSSPANMGRFIANWVMFMHGMEGAGNFGMFLFANIFISNDKPIIAETSSVHRIRQGLLNIVRTNIVRNDGMQINIPPLDDNNEETTALEVDSVIVAPGFPYYTRPGLPVTLFMDDRILKGTPDFHNLGLVLPYPPEDRDILVEKVTVTSGRNILNPDEYGVQVKIN